VESEVGAALIVGLFYHLFFLLLLPDFDWAAKHSASRGALGDGTANNRNAPVAVGNSDNIVARDMFPWPGLNQVWQYVGESSSFD
jgi:hypothetical protein